MKETYIHVRATEEIKEKLRIIAKRNSRSQAQQLEYMINKQFEIDTYLENQKINPQGITY